MEVFFGKIVVYFNVYVYIGIRLYVVYLNLVIFFRVKFFVSFKINWNIMLILYEFNYDFFDICVWCFS